MSAIDNIKVGDIVELTVRTGRPETEVRDHGQVVWLIHRDGGPAFIFEQDYTHGHDSAAWLVQPAGGRGGWVSVCIATDDANRDLCGTAFTYDGVFITEEE